MRAIEKQDWGKASEGLRWVERLYNRNYIFMHEHLQLAMDRAKQEHGYDLSQHEIWTAPEDDALRQEAARIRGQVKSEIDKS